MKLALRQSNREADRLNTPFPLREDAAADILEVRGGFHGSLYQRGGFGEGITGLFQDRPQLAQRC